MTDKKVKETLAVARAKGLWTYALLLTELLAHRKAQRRLRRAWGKYGPSPGGPGANAATIDVLNVKQK